MKAGIWASVAVAMVVIVVGLMVDVLFEHHARIRTLEQAIHVHDRDTYVPRYPPDWRPR